MATKSTQTPSFDKGAEIRRILGGDRVVNESTVARSIGLESRVADAISNRGGLLAAVRAGFAAAGDNYEKAYTRERLRQADRTAERERELQEYAATLGL